MDLYDRHGHRKYLNLSEWNAFLRAAEASAPDVNAFCRTLAYSGCRLSEALELTTDRIDVVDGALILESLKKRRRGVYRAVPVPPELLTALVSTHEITAQPSKSGKECGVRVWNWSRATAWRRVCEVMAAAGISGMHATPRGLRHGFGIRAVSAGVPITMTQKWMGHASLTTTAIYINAMGSEEREIARRMWG